MDSSNHYEKEVLVVWNGKEDRARRVYQSLIIKYIMIKNIYVLISLNRVFWLNESY